MLEHLGLTNFKAFRRQNVLLKPFTLLTGLNSSGKSTVLQALAMLRQSFDAGVLDADSRRFRPSLSRGFLLNGELVELGTGQDVRHEAFIDDDPNITIELAESRHRGRVVNSWTAGYGREDDLLRSVEPTSRIYQDDDGGPYFSVFRPGFQYLRADRIVPAVSYPRSHQIAVTRGFLGVRGEHTANFLRAYQDSPVPQENVRRPETSSPRLLDQTDAWMQRLCPGVNLQAIGIEGTDAVRLSYGFGLGSGASNRYRPTNVGFGLTYALPIVVACLSAEPGSLILLENPEAHLHPRGQTELAYLACAAAAGGAQLIVETHSDHVLNGMRLAVKNGSIPASATAVHFFRRVNQAAEIVSPRIGEDGMLSEWPEGFFDEWENSLDKLLD